MQTRSPQPNTGSAEVHTLRWRFWLLVPATGIAAGITAGLLMRLLQVVQRAAWGQEANQSLLDAVQASTPATRVLILFGIGILVALARSLLQRTTGGHGAEMVAAIWFKAGAMPFWRTTAQSIVSIIIVGLGASLGREAAPKQMGAVFGSVFASWAELSSSHRRLLAAFGAGAGIAAVYNVPFGGALFALEVLLGTVSLALIAPAFVAAGLATAVAWLLLPDEPTYHVDLYTTTPSLIGWAILFGPAAGLVSAAYVRLIAWSDALKPKKQSRLLLVPVLIFAVLGAAAIPLPQLLGNGKDVVQLAFTSQLGVPLLIVLVLLKPLATAACLGSGAPGGLLTPTLTLGAVFGGLCGQGWLYVWPGEPTGAFAIIGAAAVLGAASQGPVSAIVLVLELTQRGETLLVPTLIAVGGAALVDRLVDARSIYSGRIHAGRALAEEHSGVTVSAATKYRDLVRTLLRTGGAEAVRVTDEAGHVVGIVDRARAIDPAVDDGPLATATALDFLARPGR